MTHTWFSCFHRSSLRIANSLHKKIGGQDFLLILSIIIGLLAGIASVLMRGVEYLCHLLPDYVGNYSCAQWIVPAIPAVGIFFCIFVTQIIAKGNYERGLCGIILGICKRNGNVRISKTFSHIITSGVSVGTGVSAGLEAPIALTGAAIGSNIAKGMLLPQNNRILLLACGSAAAISAMFNSPVAGAFFAIEIILPYSTNAVSAMIPLILSSSTALVVSRNFWAVHAISGTLVEWNIHMIPYYILLGISSGLVAAFVITVYAKETKIFSKISNPWMKGLAGAVSFYFALLLFPALRGQGYAYVNALLNHDISAFCGNSPLAFVFQSPYMFLVLVFMMIFLKAMASITCLETGADGGIFAPSMCIGAFLGYAVAQFLTLLNFPLGHEINASNFIVIGMGGVLAGVMHAPLTGIFLIAELTCGYVLFIPLMIVAALSSFICKKLCPYNVYKMLIAEKGENPNAAQDAEALHGVVASNVMETDCPVIHEDVPLREILNIMMKSHHNIFPVVDCDENITGIISLDDVREYLFANNLYDLALAFDIKKETDAVLEKNDSLGKAIYLFEKFNLSSIPVVKENKYIGCVTKSHVFDKYRYMIENRKELFS